MVFRKKERTNWKHKAYTQSQHEFLDQSAWPLCAIIRNFINEWTGKLSADRAFISRLTSKNDKQHLAAIFELLIFGLFKGAGLHIVPNPVMPSTKTPDFILWERPKDVLLECTLTSNALESVDENRQKGGVLQIIEDLQAFPFYVNIAFSKLSPHSISKRDFLKFLHTARAENGHLTPSQQSADYCYCGQGWGLVITLTKKPHDAHTRALGYCSCGAKTVDNNRVLMTALNGKKASRYKIDGRPYIICVSVDDITAGEEEFSNVLFGPNYGPTVRISEKSNGFFLWEGQPQNTSVSAVLFCERFTVFGLLGCAISLWHNPYATNKLFVGQFPFKEIIYREDGSILHRSVTEKKPNIIELLNIDEEKYKDALQFENRRSPTPEKQ